MSGGEERAGARQGIFEGEDTPKRALVDDCVHCGFCLPACPTYGLWREEMDSPRGRVYLVKLGLDGEAPMSRTYVEHFDRCLGCMACVPACPSGVRYGSILEATRAQIERHGARTLADRLFRATIFALFPHPGRLAALARLLWLYQRTGLRGALVRIGLRRLFPARLEALERLAPELTLEALRTSVPETTPAAGTRRLRVGLLLGCVQRVFFAETNAATARVLAAEGCEVVAPREQGCCGALMVHAGRRDAAREHARRMIEVFERSGVDLIAINAAGCGSTMKEYAELLAEDPRYAERARRLAAICRDVTELLAGLEPRATRHPLDATVAYHAACHLHNAQGVTDAPRTVLASIPGLEVVEIADGGVCCGSAGIYNLVEPETARELGDLKARAVAETGAEVVATTNPGCLLQISDALGRARAPIAALHVVELLDASIRGIGMDRLPREEL